MSFYNSREKIMKLIAMSPIKMEFVIKNDVIRGE